MKTKAGNFAMVNYDGSGRMYMIDEAGTLYYDTGEPSLGIYIVSCDACSLNAHARPVRPALLRWLPAQPDCPAVGVFDTFFGACITQLPL